jgi:hypothetical protein
MLSYAEKLVIIAPNFSRILVQRPLVGLSGRDDFAWYLALTTSKGAIIKRWSPDRMQIHRISGCAVGCRAHVTKQSPVQLLEGV